MRRSTFLMLVILAAAPVAGSAQIARSPVVENYEAVIAGRIRFSDLSPRDAADVASLDRELRRTGRQTMTIRERCRRAQHPNPEPPSALEERVLSLKCGD